jgi:hypothetical protein
MNKPLTGWRALALTLLVGLALDAVADQPQAATSYSLDPVLARTDVWSLSPDTFAAAVAEGGFQWQDAQKSTARGGTRVKLRFLELRIWEALVRFEEQRIGRVELFFYNRGDAGDLDAKRFADLLESVTGALSNWVGVAATPLPDVLGAARAKIQRVAWTKPPARLELEWSVTKPRVQNGEQIDYRSEFIRLKLSPAAAAITPAPQRTTTTRPATAHPAAVLKARVKTADSGDVSLAEVPMVDQGAKGYCAAAVAARVMGYYGLDFDQHQAAQVAGTTAKGGTKGNHLRDALKRIAQKNSLRLVEVEDYTGPAIMRLIGDYNRAASAARKPKVSLESTGHSLDGLLQAMEADLLRQARTKRQMDLTHLKNDVIKYVDTGIPLIWDVYLGLVEEQPKLSEQTHGGHLRLIIGYNKKTDEILYTDSWGQGHELKRVGLGDALTMTFGLYVIKPNRL